MRQYQLLVFCLAMLVSIHLQAGGGQLIVDFTISDGPFGAGQVVTFADASNPTSCHGGINSWSWDFGNGASPATANTQGPHEVTYSTLGTKSIRLDLTGVGCGPRLLMKTIEVTQPPIPTMSQWSLFILGLVLVSIAVVRISTFVKYQA